MAYKKGDFIELEYTGTLKEEGVVFDTTDETVAKDNQIHNAQTQYGPVIVCIGEGHVIKGLDENLVGKVDGEYEIIIAAEEAFGKKNPKLLRLLPLSAFRKQ